MKNKIKQNILKIFTATIIVVMITTSYAIGQWTTNGVNIYNNNLGYVGFNNTNNFTNPAYQIDCKGDINVNLAVSNASAFRIGGNRMLWNNNNLTDLFVGYQAGNTGMSGHANVLIGDSVGNAITTGYYNVGVGSKALLNTTTSYGTTAVGFWAAKFNTIGCGLTAVGEEALRDNTTGNSNTGLGTAAVHSNKTGSFNVCVGSNAGSGVLGKSYSYNSFFGALSGQSIAEGGSNVFLGYSAGQANSYSSDNVAVGHSALYTQSYTNTNTAYSSYNTAVGNYALYSNQPTTSTNGRYNSALGYNALRSNATGIGNVACGHEAGYSNTGTSNVYVGAAAGYTNTASYSTFLGYAAGYANTSGAYNSFVGYSAGQANTTGGGNTFVGLDAGYTQTDADSNSAVGLQALGSTTGGTNLAGSNAALGYKAGFANTTGYRNTFIGSIADANANNYNNCGAIGYNTVVTASNKIFMGDLNLIGCYNVTGVWGMYSDARFKINVKEEVKGLEFINKLRPVTYNYDTKKLNDFLHPNKEQYKDSLGKVVTSSNDDFTESTKRIHSGFIAQEVEVASKECDFTSSIVGAPANSNDLYTINLSEFVVPLVKAVQELSAKLQTLDSTNQSLQNQLNKLRGQHPVSSTLDNSSNRLTAIDVTLLSGSIVLDQNQPNPFREQTIITYFIPDDSRDVKIIFTDSKGTVLKEVEITQTGQGQLNVYAQDLSSGIYSYTLVADGITIDSKKMVCNK